VRSAVVDWVLVRRTTKRYGRCVHVHALAEGIERLLRRAASVEYCTLRDRLQQVEKYDSDSSGGSSEGEVGNKEEGRVARCCRRSTD